MMRAPLTLLVSLITVVVSLYAAWVQCQNFALAGELDSMTKDSAWLERCIGEQEERLAELTYRAERELAGSQADVEVAEEQAERSEAPDA